MNISTETPTLEEVTRNAVDPKPIAFANNSFPYLALAPRRFEELIYAIFRSELENQNFDLKFDSIMLMSGVSEQGRDCSIYKINEPVGLIQCKRYATAVSRQECIDEILKFLLHATIDESLVPKAGPIQYYFIATSGFGNTATDFLPRFAEYASDDAEIASRCEKVKKDFVGLADLDISVKLPYIKSLIARIKVTPVNRVDLDSYLSREHNLPLVASFFEVKAVLNKEGSEALEKLVHYVTEGILPLPDQFAIQVAFLNASSVVRNQTKQFGRSIGHIQRDIVNDIISSLDQPTKRGHANVGFVVGSAGMGKSVVMSDLLTYLEEHNIPALAIKSDRQNGVSLIDLQTKLGLTFPIVSGIKKLANEKSKFVLLIDQLDVLSQSFATNKEYLHTILNLISELKNHEGVNIIVSVRKFDLEHNQDLRVLTSMGGKKEYVVGELNVDEVNKVLNNLGPNPIRISPTLQKLLRTPKNLDVFCLVFHPEIETGSLNSEFDLYDLLWRRIIIEQGRAQNLTMVADFVYGFTEAIEKRSTLAVPRIIFDDQFALELNFLLSQGLVVSSDSEVQFFHQSFFDYALARQFQETKRDLLEFILAQDNSISIRSTVRAVLHYLSLVEVPKTYYRITRGILSSHVVTYNMKLIVVESIARNLPKNNELYAGIEQDFVLKDSFAMALFENIDNGDLFEASINLNWLDMFLNENVRSIERWLVNWMGRSDRLRLWMARRGKERFGYDARLNIVHRLVQNKINYQPVPTLTWLKSTSCIKDKDRFVFRILYSFTRWEIPQSFEILNSVIHLMKRDRFSTFHILSNISNYNASMAFDFYKNHVFSPIEFCKDTYKFPNPDHHESEFLRKVIAASPDIVLSQYLPLIDAMASKSISIAQTDDYFFTEMNLMFFDYKDSGSRDNDLLSHLIDACVKLAGDDIPSFEALFKIYQKTQSAAIQIILFYGLKVDAQKYSSLVYQSICFVHEKTLFDLDGNFGTYFRSLLGTGFEFLNDTGKQNVMNMVVQIQPDHDKKVIQFNGKRHYPKWTGSLKLKFFQVIPDDSINNYPNAKKEFDELKRKFVKPILDEPSGIRTYGIRPPLKGEAYSKMSLSNWKESFIKYNKEREHEFGSDKGGLTEHSRAFGEQVAIKPEFFYDFISQILDDTTISPVYSFSGLDGLIKAGYNPEKVEALYLKLIPLSDTRFDVLQLIWHSSYLIEKGRLHDTILEFLIKQGEENEDPTVDDSDDSPIQTGINSVRGACADRLLRLASINYSDRMREVVKKLAEDPAAPVRIIVLSNLQYLLRHDREEIFKLFKAILNDESHKEFWTVSITTAQYLVESHFESMRWYFDAMMADEELAKDAVRILARYYIWNDADCRPLMHEYYKKYPSTVPDIILFVDGVLISETNEINIKATELYWSFLNNRDVKIATAYNNNFIHFKPEHFSLHFKYLLLFSRSRSGKQSSHYLWSYLLKCVREHAEDCLNILNNYAISDYDSLENDYVDDSLIRLIMAIYSRMQSLGNYEPVIPMINGVLDRVMLSEKYRRYTSSALQLSEQ